MPLALAAIRAAPYAASMRTLATLLILPACLVNLAPVVGVVSAEWLQRLYGIPFEGTELLILMRHRALLFAIVGGLLAASVFHRPLRPVAIAAGLFSMLSFVAIVQLLGGANAELQRAVLLDLVASAGLVAAALLDPLARER